MHQVSFVFEVSNLLASQKIIVPRMGASVHGAKSLLAKKCQMFKMKTSQFFLGDNHFLEDVKIGVHGSIKLS
jgi:hypothetical protein